MPLPVYSSCLQFTFRVCEPAGLCQPMVVVPHFLLVLQNGITKKMLICIKFLIFFAGEIIPKKLWWRMRLLLLVCVRRLLIYIIRAGESNGRIKLEKLCRGFQVRVYHLTICNSCRHWCKTRESLCINILVSCATDHQGLLLMASSQQQHYLARHLVWLHHYWCCTVEYLLVLNYLNSNLIAKLLKNY